VLGLGYEREDEGRANLTNKMGVMMMMMMMMLIQI
jgi:hypothetical protein